jgi:WD40 repeat protein
VPSPGWGRHFRRPITACLINDYHECTGSDAVASVAFSPDGKTLATADGDGNAGLWNVSYLADVLARLCSQVGGSLTRTEWTRYVPPGPSYRNVCAQHS